MMKPENPGALKTAYLSRVLFHIAGMYCYNQISYKVYSLCRTDIIRLMLTRVQADLPWPN
jgi:hypothetical protein